MADIFNISKQRREELLLAWNEVQFLLKIKKRTMTLYEFLFVLKSLGIQLTKKEKFILQQEYKIRGDFTFEDLLHIGSVSWTEEILEECLLKSLRLLDTEKKGKVSASQLRETLYKLGVGIRLSLEEVDTFLSMFREFPEDAIPIDVIILRLLGD